MNASSGLPDRALNLRAPEEDSPEAMCQVAERYALLDACIREKRHRAVLRLRYVEQLSFADIGQRLGVSGVAVHAMHRRILAAMRRALGARGITAFRHM